METLTAPARSEAEPRPAVRATAPDCEECMGAGGWYRYEPSLDPAPGLL